jgi:tetratricopeptide (TPR) repeat protein
VLPSLARSLVLAGAPAVLGWAAPVSDLEATLFASLLYQRFTAGEDLAHALAYARLELAVSDELAPNGSHDWHLARLFLSPGGGGALATAGGPQRHLGYGQAMKTFLDAKGKQVPVAGELEFVGRRREIQAILREFRAPISERHAGVFIHGVGRQGKSSLAARVAHRLEHSHETVVIFKRYDAPFILRTLGERLATPAVTDIVNRHLPLVEADKSKLLPALTELLEGPCAQAGEGGAKPVLLVMDDFERALDEENRQTLKPEYFDSIRALLLAFEAATTESHLLLTCRFRFTCPHDAKDLADADHLLDVPLHGLNEREAHRQARAKLRLPEVARLVSRLPGKKRKVLEEQIDRIIVNARGNPGLQDLLFTLAVQDPAACDRCLAQMEEFLRSGKLPAEDKVRAFLENLALKELTGLLSPAQRELLRASTLFELPVPAAVMTQLCRRRRKESLGSGEDESERLLTSSPTAAEDTARLLALSLWEVYEDLHDPQAPALALNALVRPLAGTLNESEQATLGGAVTGALFEQWGGEKGGKQRGWLQNHELTRLGLLARDARVLAATGASALRFLDNQFQYRQAAAWAKDILAIVDAANVPTSVDLLRTAAERCQQVGEVAEANTFRERAMQLLGQGGETDTVQNAATLLTHARALVEQGQPDEALRHLEQAEKLLPPGREQAIVLGAIAEIQLGKGDVNTALDIHQQELRLYEALGDKHSRAVTLGEIARIKRQKGEVDAALQLHQERLGIFEALGAKRERAVTLGDIARIRADKGEVDAALQLHQEMLGIFEALGDLDGKANMLWSIAQIEVQREKWQEAYDHLAESYAINLKLGRLDGICMVGLSLGQLLCMAGQREQGLAILTRSRDGFLKLGQARMAQQTQALLDRISQSPPQP